MKAIGVSEDDFEQIAKKLYFAWKDTHREQAETLERATRTSRQTTAATAAPPVQSSSRFWCFQMSAGGLWGDCVASQAECSQARVNLMKRDCEFPPPGISHDDCVKIQANVLDVSECAGQGRAACFRVHYIVNDADVTACAPTMGACKGKPTNIRVSYDTGVRVSKRSETQSSRNTAARRLNSGSEDVARNATPLPISCRREAESSVRPRN